MLLPDPLLPTTKLVSPAGKKKLAFWIAYLSLSYQVRAGKVPEYTPPPPVAPAPLRQPWDWHKKHDVGLGATMWSSFNLPDLWVLVEPEVTPQKASVEELRGILEDAWRLVAPKELVEAYDLSSAE